MQNSGLLRRFGSMLYDSLLVIALLLLATIPFVFISTTEIVEPETPLHQVTLFLVVYAFFVGFWSRKGRTLGMQSWGLQLQDTNDAVPTVSRCTLRFFAAIFSLSAAGLGFLWQIVDKENLTWHDRISGTRLVHYPKVPEKQSAQ